MVTHTCGPSTPTLVLGQEACFKFKTNLSYMVSFRRALATE